ncbi:MAG: response regulator transcription factor [SAR202 cluster bacterium]|nr:response regulator transcription factor [SAR202 cluster bacterium]
MARVDSGFASPAAEDRRYRSRGDRAGVKGMGNKVLVIEDEQAPRDLLRDALEEAGYQVATAADGREGLRVFFTQRPCLVIMDIMMPNMDGWDLLGRIREVSQTPVIILSALGREHEMVRGLRAGADDYMIKPVRISELLARVEAALRKSNAPETPNHAYADEIVAIDHLRHSVAVRGDSIDLTPQEFRLLSVLVQNAGMVLSTDRLSDMCWGVGAGGAETIRVYIGHLRKKLGDDAKRPALIETVREFGYRYSPPQAQVANKTA